MSQVLEKETLEKIVPENEKVIVVTEDMIKHLRSGGRIKVENHSGEFVHLTINENEFEELNILM